MWPSERLALRALTELQDRGVQPDQLDLLVRGDPRAHRDHQVQPVRLGPRGPQAPKARKGRQVQPVQPVRLGPRGRQDPFRVMS
jgi:hypothetical protein